MIYLPNPKYNPNNTNGAEITSRLRLADGITIATFLGHGASGIGHISSPTERSQLARNLYLHAELMNHVNDNPDQFSRVRVTVSEGIYEAGPLETLAGENLLKSNGRMVVYQVYNRRGQIDHGATFDIAKYWKDNTFYDLIALDYDRYNPDGSLSSQIIVQFKDVPSSFDIEYGLNIETRYNGNLISKNEFIEVLEN